MAIEGALREFGLQDILQLLEMARKTGVLTLRSDAQDDEAVLHFDRGEIIYAQRRKSARRLGQQLLRAGKLTERELRRALELQERDPAQRLGRILLEMGSVDAADLEHHLRFQIEERVYDLLSWSDGRFHFEESSDIGAVEPQVRVRVDSVLMEGARRIDEWARLEATIPSAESIPVLAPTDGPEAAPLELHPGEWEVLAEIDGERDVGRIAADLGKSSFDVARTIYGLVRTGVVQVETRPRRIEATEFEDRIAEITSLLESGDADTAGRLAAELGAAHPERADLALLEGRALAAQGRLRAATEAFARAVGLDPLSVEAHNRLGYAAARIGELGRAAKAWEMVLRLSTSGREKSKATRALDAVRALDEILGEEDA